MMGLERHGFKREGVGGEVVICEEHIEYRFFTF